MNVKNMQIGFIGGGNMATAIISGLKTNGFAMQCIHVVEPDLAKRTQLATTFNVQVHETSANLSAVQVIVLAVKPQQLKAVCHDLQSTLTTQLIISIAAGIRSTDLARWLNDYKAIVRVMPNTPAQIQAGVSALYALATVSEAQRMDASTILAAVGKIVWLDDEAQMDAVTAISGSGPAYVFYMIEALQEAGIALGLKPQDATLLALQTFAGASQLAVQSLDTVQTLRSQVTSKGGTTEQGILALESANMKHIILKAAQAAAEKSVLLGDMLGNQS